MRDSEEKPRNFAFKNKRSEENFDEPVLRRRKDTSSSYEPRDRKIDDEDDSSVRAGFFARHRMKDDEDDGANTRKSLRKRGREDYDEDEYEEEEDSANRAPFLVRMFAWGALLAIFFVCGYLGANYFFNWADKKGGSRVGNVIGSGSEIERSQNTGGTPSDVTGNVKYTLYIPEDGKFTTREIDIKKGMQEEDIEKVVSMYVDGLKEINIFESGVRTLNIFRSGDWLYLDMTGAFQKSLKTLGKDKAALAITGLVKTIKENFPPITKVKFYIDGRESKENSPADLSRPWEIK